MTIQTIPFGLHSSFTSSQPTSTNFLPVFQLFSFTPLALAIAAQTNSGGSVSDGRLTSCCSVHFCRVVLREHVHRTAKKCNRSPDWRSYYCLIFLVASYKNHTILEMIWRPTCNTHQVGRLSFTFYRICSKSEW